MKWLSIDYGRVRTGIAVTDASGCMAFPRTTVVARPQEHRRVFFAALMTIIEAEKPDALVVGLPLHVDGQEHDTTRLVRTFVARLQHRTCLPIYLMPEILSSHEAETQLAEAGVKARKMRPMLDQQAAVRILESFLAEKNPERLLA